MKKFTIASLTLAGFLPFDTDAASSGTDSRVGGNEENFSSILDRTLPFTLAGHSSHRVMGLTEVTEVPAVELPYQERHR